VLLARVERTFVDTIGNFVPVSICFRRSTIANSGARLERILPTPVEAIQTAVSIRVRKGAEEAEVERDVEHRRVGEDVHGFAEERTLVRIPAVRATQLDCRVGSHDSGHDGFLEEGNLVPQIADDDLSLFSSDVL
jgi:hypothetical protein